MQKQSDLCDLYMCINEKECYARWIPSRVAAECRKQTKYINTDDQKNFSDELKREFARVKDLSFESQMFLGKKLELAVVFPLSKDRLSLVPIAEDLLPPCDDLKLELLSPSAVFSGTECEVTESEIQTATMYLAALIRGAIRRLPVQEWVGRLLIEVSDTSKLAFSDQILKPAVANAALALRMHSHLVKRSNGDNKNPDHFYIPGNHFDPTGMSCTLAAIQNSHIDAKQQFAAVAIGTPKSDAASESSAEAASVLLSFEMSSRERKTVVVMIPGDAWDAENEYFFEIHVVDDGSFHCKCSVGGRRVVLALPTNEANPKQDEGAVLTLQADRVYRLTLSKSHRMSCDLRASILRMTRERLYVLTVAKEKGNVSLVKL